MLRPCTSALLLLAALPLAATFHPALVTRLHAQDLSTPPTQPGHQTQWVRFLSPQQATVVAGRPSVLELHFAIAPKLHINSHNPPSETQIPTRLAVTNVPGMKVSAVDFPAGEPFTFSLDPSEKLDVYTGEFVLKVHVVSQAGSHLLEGVLRYQACDANACYPPRTLPVAVSVFAK